VVTVIDNAKKLRGTMTDAEKLLWRHLRGHRLLGEKFRRQQPIGRYIVDFVHFGAGLIVEADGGQHCDDQDDVARSEWLRSQGFKILRFWNHEMLSNTTVVLETIISEVNGTPLPSPLPQGERE
jgi:very-short-patch-repair endonuclease